MHSGPQITKIERSPWNSISQVNKSAHTGSFSGLGSQLLYKQRDRLGGVNDELCLPRTAGIMDSSNAPEPHQDLFNFCRTLRPGLLTAVVA